MEAKFGWILVLAILWKNSIRVESVKKNKIAALTEQIKAERFEIIINNNIGVDDEEPYYTGEVNIQIVCLQKTQTILLYDAGFYVELSSLAVKQLSSENQNTIVNEDNAEPNLIKLKPGKKLGYFSEYDFLNTIERVKSLNDGAGTVMVTLEEFLEENCKYVIKIRFHGKYNEDGSNYILRTYKNKRGYQKYMVFTKFRSDARPIFPFLYQIDVKINFKLWLYYPKALNLRGFSNAISQARTVVVVKEDIKNHLLQKTQKFIRLKNSVFEEESEETVPIAPDNPVFVEEFEEIVPIAADNPVFEEEFEQTVPIAPDNPVYEEEFEETVPIAPSSVAIALLDFQSTGVDKKFKVNVQTWTDEFVIEKVSPFNEIVSDIFTYFTQFYFDMSHPLQKLNVFTLPNVTFEMEENIGLIFMSEQLVLHVMDKHAGPYKFRLVSDLCHAVSFQWYGGVVIMGDVTENWWHRGLNKFLQTECVRDLYSEFNSNLSELSVTESFINFLRSEETKEYEQKSMAESYPDSHPVINMPEEKAYHLVRMLRFFMGSDNLFYDALNKYVWKFESKSANLAEALDIFRNVSDSPILSYYGIATIMESWFRQKGIPMITVERNYKNKEVKMSQKIFNALELEEQTKKRKECWSILITYTTSNILNFGEYADKIWLDCKNQVKIFRIDNLTENDWILCSVDFEVPGRVMYDLKNYEAIQNTLLDPNRYNKIRGLTRVRIVSDIFALAEGALLSYKIVFDTMMYLKHERLLAPWKIALKELDRIRSRLLGSDLFEKYQKLVREILEPVLEKQKFSSLTDPSFTNNLDTHLGVLIYEYSCKFGVTFCHRISSEILNKWRNTKGFSENLKSHHVAYKVVMCEHFKDPGNENSIKEFFSPNYVNDQPDAKEDLLQTFGCSRNVEILKMLLDASIQSNPNLSPEDSIIIFQSLSSNEKGYELMKKFFMEKYARIKSFHSRDWKHDHFKLSYLSILFDNTNSREDLDDVSLIIRDKNRNLQQARFNIRRLQRNNED